MLPQSIVLILLLTATAVVCCNDALNILLESIEKSWLLKFPQMGYSLLKIHLGKLLILAGSYAFISIQHVYTPLCNWLKIGVVTDSSITLAWSEGGDFI